MIQRIINTYTYYKNTSINRDLFFIFYRLLLLNYLVNHGHQIVLLIGLAYN